MNTKSKAIMLPKILMVALSLVLIASYFCPFVSATGEHREYLLSHPDGGYIESVDMSNGDAADLSLFEYTMFYARGAAGQFSQDVTTFYMIFYAAPMVLALVSLLLSCLGKATGTVIFAILTAPMIRAIQWDALDRRIVSDTSDMVFGFGLYVYYAGAVLLAVASIWLFVVKHKAKRATKQD